MNIFPNAPILFVSSKRASLCPRWTDTLNCTIAYHLHFTYVKENFVEKKFVKSQMNRQVFVDVDEDESYYALDFFLSLIINRNYQRKRYSLYIMYMLSFIRNSDFSCTSWNLEKVATDLTFEED